jgi:hypothetical protein
MLSAARMVLPQQSITPANSGMIWATEPSPTVLSRMRRIYRE